MSLKGAGRHSARLKALASPRMVRAVNAALYAGADEIKAHAQHLITDGSVSGAGHVPSAKGEPPNADTHVLDRSIEAYQRAPLTAEVIADAPYAARLEFEMDRQFMAPSRDAKRDRVNELVAGAINQVAKTGG